MTAHIEQHEAADALRQVALWLDSGDILSPDDPPRVFTAENVHGFDLLVRHYPDGRVTISTRGGSWLSWSAETELTRAEVAA